METAEASNAPLGDASTFEGIGLHPLLTAHLAKKMDVTKPTAIQQLALPKLLYPMTTHELSLDMLNRSTLSNQDVFIQSQTGSGKTLTYLLPIIQDLLPLSTLSYIDRSVGTLAIILAPTRELARQISEVLDVILSMSLTNPDLKDDTAEGRPSRKLSRWMVSGLLTGGATRTHEKARLRKGVPILVATPGRLLDHLQNTSCFNVSKCRWLILDEADRFLELGFEETIKGILHCLSGRKNIAKAAMESGLGLGSEISGWDWNHPRRNVLCSATIQDNVQKLAGTLLKNPVMLKESDAKRIAAPQTTQDSTFMPPSQLNQQYVIMPLKLRLVALAALLRSLTNSDQVDDAKVIVFFSSTDSVDYHWRLFGGLRMGEDAYEGVTPSSESEDASDAAESFDEESEEEHHKRPKPRTPKSAKAKGKEAEQLDLTCPLLPSVHIYHLHGSMSLADRTKSLRGFASSTNKVPAVLFCTSVASRGLDLPLVRAVVQYDLPTEGGVNEYVHRVGRTARAGRQGESWSFILPSEAGWVPWITKGMTAVDGTPPRLRELGLATILLNGFGGLDTEYEARATDAQMAFERWVLSKEQACYSS